MLLEIHMLKNFPPTNLNRDDSGSPKTAYFGGVQRGRVSSQCLKHSWRVSPLFYDSIGSENLGVRTKLLPEVTGNELHKLGLDEKYVQIAKKALMKLGKNDSKAKGEPKEVETEETVKEEVSKMKQIGFFSNYEINTLALLISEIAKGCPDVKKFEAELKATLSKRFIEVNVGKPSVDMAMFGRMITSDMFDNVDASVQVAHAISTNAVNIESDYFTAVDDLAPADGAAMIGDSDFNSSCYYIYASIDTDKLKKNLKLDIKSDDAIKKMVTAIIEAMSFSNPSGKQNSYAGNILPEVVLVECKDRKIPVSYVNAYATPAKPTRDMNLIEISIQKLIDEVNSIDSSFGLPSRRYWFCNKKHDRNLNVKNCSNYKNFYEMLNELNKIAE